MFGASEATSPGFPWQYLRGTRCLSSTRGELKDSEPLSDQQSPSSNLGPSTQLKSAPSCSFSSSQTSRLVIQNSGKMLGGYYLWKQPGRDRTWLFPVVYLHSSRLYGHNQSIFCTDQGLTAVCCVNTHLSSEAGVAVSKLQQYVSNQEILGLTGGTQIQPVQVSQLGWAPQRTLLTSCGMHPPSSPPGLDPKVPVRLFWLFRVISCTHLDLPTRAGWALHVVFLTWTRSPQFVLSSCTRPSLENGWTQLWEWLNSFPRSTVKQR